MTALSIPVSVMPHAEGLPLPFYAKPGSAGMDLHAALPEAVPVILAPLERKLVPTGLRLALPLGFEAQIRPRSGLAFKQGLTVLNSPGTIDHGYLDEIFVLLVNLSSHAVTIHRGERIAQMVIARHETAELVVDPTHADFGGFDRGGGFGSSGV
jgi:dUTP pyrophosphatase